MGQHTKQNAEVAKLAAAIGLGPIAERLVGSNPTLGTTRVLQYRTKYNFKIKKRLLPFREVG